MMASDNSLRAELIRRGVLKPREEVPGVEEEAEEGQAEAEVLTVQMRDMQGDEFAWVRATWGQCAQLPSYQEKVQRRDGSILRLRVEPKKRPQRWITLDGTRARTGLDASLCMRAQNLLIDVIMAESDVSITVAHDPEIDAPAGWLCQQGATLHYVFTEPRVRRLQVARQLVLHSRCTHASHMTRHGAALVKYLASGA